MAENTLLARQAQTDMDAYEEANKGIIQSPPPFVPPIAPTDPTSTTIAVSGSP